jgi:hypothetical protein
MVKFLFFFSFFVALTSLILNQQSNIIYLLKKPRYFIFSDKLSEYTLQKKKKILPEGLPSRKKGIRKNDRKFHIRTPHFS